MAKHSYKCSQYLEIRGIEQINFQRLIPFLNNDGEKRDIKTTDPRDEYGQRFRNRRNIETANSLSALKKTLNEEFLCNIRGVCWW